MVQGAGEEDVASMEIDLSWLSENGGLVWEKEPSSWLVETGLV